MIYFMLKGNYNLIYFSLPSISKYFTITLACLGTIPSTGLLIGRHPSSAYISSSLWDIISQPYTKYGLEGHVAGEDFTAEEQASAKQVLYNVISSAGIDIDLSSCTSTSGGVSCGFLKIDNGGYRRVSIGKSGALETLDNFAYQSGFDRVTVSYDGTANCFLR